MLSCEPPPPSQVELAKLKEDSPQLMTKAEELLKAIKWVCKVEKHESRKERMNQRYAVDRVSAQFVNNGFKQQFAKRLAQYLHLKHCDEELSTFEQASFMKTTSEAFTKDQVCQLGELNGEKPGSLAEYMHNMLEGARGAIDKKRDSIGKVVARKSWRGGMGKLDLATVADFDFGYGLAGEDMTDMGALPWLVCVNGNCWRWGPNDSPMPGLPQVIAPLTRTMLVSVFEARAILGIGLSISDIRELLDSASGPDFMKESTITTEVEKGHSIYIPMGYIPLVTYQYERKQDCYPWGRA